MMTSSKACVMNPTVRGGPHLLTSREVKKKNRKRKRKDLLSSADAFIAFSQITNTSTEGNRSVIKNNFFVKLKGIFEVS